MAATYSRLALADTCERPRKPVPARSAPRVPRPGQRAFATEPDLERAVRAAFTTVSPPSSCARLTGRDGQPGAAVMTARPRPWRPGRRGAAPRDAPRIVGSPVSLRRRAGPAPGVGPRRARRRPRRGSPPGLRGHRAHPHRWWWRPTSGRGSATAPGCGSRGSAATASSPGTAAAAGRPWSRTASARMSASRPAVHSPTGSPCSRRTRAQRWTRSASPGVPSPITARMRSRRAALSPESVLRGG